MEAHDPGPATPPHYITAATSLPERRLRTLKFSDAFAVLDSSGDIPGEPDAPEGIYHYRAFPRRFVAGSAISGLGR